MDRRSWLWRRKSSEKSPESSGSLSSHSERFSDDQTSSNHINMQSTEVVSKAEVDNESSSEKLSDALVNMRANEDLVKQHAKVAEEAVSGWERAEKEVTVLKKQNEALIHQNLILEERMGHLDEALKECLRQHRQKEDELHSLIQNANEKLEAVEKDKSILRVELEIRSRERDSATKKHVDTLKKVAKLEAECLQLKARANDYLMDDFLEMEKLVEGSGESRLREELEELEDSLRKITAEKERLEIEVKDAGVKLMLLGRDNEAVQKESEKNLEKIRIQLKETSEAKMKLEEELEAREESISRLEREVEREKNASRKAVGKCEVLEAEIARMKSAEVRIVNEVDLDRQVAMAAMKFAQCQKTIASMGRQLKSLATFDDFMLDSERQQVTVA